MAEFAGTLSVLNHNQTALFKKPFLASSPRVAFDSTKLSFLGGLDFCNKPSLFVP